MNLAWCMIALSMIGAEDQAPSKSQPPGVAALTIGTKTAEIPNSRPMDLATATLIAFDNSEDFRIVECGISSGTCYLQMHPERPFAIVRLDAETSIGQFKTGAMALVRSVEQRYWNLAQAQVALESAEQAVGMQLEVFNKAQAKVTMAHGDPGLADLAEALPRLEQFNNDVVTRKADVVAAEIALRKILGISPTDNRRLITATKPTGELLSFDWDTCVAELLREQPDNLQQQGAVRLAELCLLIARNQFIFPLESHTLRQLTTMARSPDSSQDVLSARFLKAFASLISDEQFVEGIDLSGNAYIDSLTWQRGFTFDTRRGPLSNHRLAQYNLLQAQARQRQVFRQTTQLLARTFLEVDVNFKQFAAAKRLRAAAAKRLASQRAYYDEGRISLDRFLDTVNQHAEAVAAESRYKTSYNISLTALSEAKGTLLADRNIVAPEGPRDIGVPQRARANAGVRRFSIDGFLDASSRSVTSGVSEFPKMTALKALLAVPSSAKISVDEPSGIH